MGERIYYTYEREYPYWIRILKDGESVRLPGEAYGNFGRDPDHIHLSREDFEKRLLEERQKGKPMAGKIYYSIDTTSVGYPVHWLDERGQEHVEKLATERNHMDSADVDKEFHIAHPGAVWLRWPDFCKRVEKALAERAKLAGWNEWVAK